MNDGIEKLKEKLVLFKSCNSLIYCKDHLFVDSVVRSTDVFADTKLFGWSFTDHKSDLYFRKRELERGVEINCSFEEQNFRIEVPFQDASSLENAGHCFAFVLSQHYSQAATLGLFAVLQPVAMRLEMKEGITSFLY